MVASDHGAPVDRTVCAPESRAKIEEYYGINKTTVDPQALAFVVAQSKTLGNDAFRAGRHKEAIRLYSQAIAGDESDAALYSNRAAAFMAEGRHEQALWDAEKCVALSPAWAKAYFRRGCAAMALCRWDLARSSFETGLDLAPGDKGMVERLAEVEWVRERRAGARRAQDAVERRGMLSRLRELRSQAARQTALRQFKQSMAGPQWDLEDLDWRPTFLPSMRTRPTAGLAALEGRHAPLLHAYLSSLADLAGPKAALGTLDDGLRWAAYDATLRGLDCEPRRVLVLEAGGGVLGLLAARALPGARVASVHRSRMLYRMARQVLQSNPEERVTLVDCSLAKLGVRGEGAAQESDGEAGAVLEERADLLVTDLLDHGVLGMGLLPAIDDAARRLLTPDACIVPQSVQVWAQLVEVTPSLASGLDLSSLDSYRWWPGPEAVALGALPHRALSAPFRVHLLDLQARLRRAGGGARDPRTVPHSAPAWELDVELEVAATATGRLTGVAYWWGAALAPGGGEGPSLASWSPDGTALSSCPVALQHLDGLGVQAGATLLLRVQQDAGQFVFSTSPPSCRARHALVPRWHFDMVRDQARNQAYDDAIGRAVERLKTQRAGGVHVLDMGAGTGLLSMMAARAGATTVVGAEINRHMCDVAEECVAANGYLGKVTMLDGDVRRMAAEPGPDGAPADLERRVDLLVYEVFDSGLIGEGVLHILAAAKQNLSVRGVELMPARARVYAQPIQLRLQHVAGFDVSQANRWRWRPDYEGISLEECRDSWVALADPIQVFAFEFADVVGNMQPLSAAHDLDFTEAGVFNAVATWFELELDEETVLSTSPHRSDKGPTWQQAVQWVPERRVAVGQHQELVASHDTYSISYKVEVEPTTSPSMAEVRDDEELGTTAASSTGVPLMDPVWKAAFDALQSLNSQIVRACAQDPLEYRALALAAIAFAARPHHYGLDASQAIEFCVKMMG